MHAHQLAWAPSCYRMHLLDDVHVSNDLLLEPACNFSKRLDCAGVALAPFNINTNVNLSRPYKKQVRKDRYSGPSLSSSAVASVQPVTIAGDTTSASVGS